MPLGRRLVQRDPTSKEPSRSLKWLLKMLWYDVMMLCTCMQKQMSVYTGNHIHTKHKGEILGGMAAVEQPEKPAAQPKKQQRKGRK